jgi:transposase
MNSQTRDLVESLLPPSLLRLESIVIEGAKISLTVRSLQHSVPCPLCQTPTSRLHSRYRRTLRDLPWGPFPVEIVLSVRRFRCARQTCPRRVFTERVPDLVAPYARATLRFRASLLAVGVALGGNPGARLGQQLRYPTSPSTLVRTLRAVPALPPCLPKVIGVDDFAKRKGQSYGTVIVDLERRRPLDVLEDRTAPTLATWLRAHPSVELVCSDRSTEYARGIAEGAPQATPVADRWHLLKNLREALERIVDRHANALRHVALPATRRASPSVTADAPPPGTLPPAHRSPREQVRRQAAQERRQVRFTHVRELHAQGMSLRAIAAGVGLSRTTVTRYVRADGFPERASRRSMPGILAPFLVHLQQRWDAGCCNGSELLREIQAQGFTGSRKQLARWIQQRRETPAPTTPTKYHQAQENLPASLREAASRPRRVSARQLSWLLVRRPERLDDGEQAALDQMQNASTDLRAAYSLAQRFGAMVRERRADLFEGWIEAVATSGISELTTFAAGLRRDETAVRMALSTDWSNGQTEGQVTKLKLLKRQGFGRMKIDLLCKRLTAAS